MTPVPPDVELLLLTWLRSHPLLADVTFGSIRPDSMPTSFVLLTRIGGDAAPMARSAPLTDTAVMDVQCWASTQHAASQLARTTRAALYESRGQHALGVISRVQPFTGLGEIPDPLAPQVMSRYGFGLTFTIH